MYIVAIREHIQPMKLPLELVPSSCWYSNVRSQVTPKTWDRLRGLVAATAGSRCTICGRAGSGHPVECHEVWGYDDERRIQRLEDLVALCPDCHLVKHFGRAMAQGRTRYALAWYAQVNGLAADQALADVMSALAVHSERSRHTWHLDVTLLSSRYGVLLNSAGQEIA